MYYVYVLKSQKNGKLYKGFTENLERRMQEHSSGKSDFTSKNGPWELVYSESFENKLDAKDEEKFLKSGKGRERLKFILKNI